MWSLKFGWSSSCYCACSITFKKEDTPPRSLLRRFYRSIAKLSGVGEIKTAVRFKFQRLTKITRKPLTFYNIGEFDTYGIRCSL